MNKFSHWIACAAVIPVAFVVMGCGGDTFDTSSFEKKVADTNRPTFSKDYTAKCPDDVSTEVGTTVTCVITDDGREISVVVTVTDEKGNITVVPKSYLP